MFLSRLTVWWAYSLWLWLCEHIMAARPLLVFSIATATHKSTPLACYIVYRFAQSLLLAFIFNAFRVDLSPA